MHFNANQGCKPLAFVQYFNSADPGALNLMGAMPALAGSGALGASAISASGFSNVTVSPQGAFALDQSCLATCGLTSAGGGFTGVSPDLATMFGLA